MVSDRVDIPAINYQQFGLADLKAYISLFAACRHKHTKFKITGTRAEIAESAKLTDKPLKKALEFLQDRRLISLKDRWREGCEILLLDPEGSGCPLFLIGLFFIQQLDRLPVEERYAECLDLMPPRTKGTTNCPFCGEPDSLFFAIDPDGWACKNCRKKGSSASLWQQTAHYRNSRDLQKRTGKTIGALALETFTHDFVEA
jgi:hypothetical protein